MMNPATAQKAAQLKANEIQLIHVGLSKLNMDEADKLAIYRNFGGGKASSKDMTWQERKRVLDHLRTKGFKQTTPRAAGKATGKPSRRLDTTPTASKVRALWLALADLGEVRDRSEPALQSYVKRITDIDDIHWCSSEDLRRLIETLKKWLIRVCLRLAPELLLQIEATDRVSAVDLQLCQHNVSMIREMNATAAQDLIADLRHRLNTAVEPQP